ncbi:YggT family protein [Teredinibacter turnerae]|uniref:YggT family protein n=1 Tax=Teredinibacter turnerae TaxID=2426 RepID=UPI00035C21EE|nr:YggT family protein [Teredinibacter turnerae]
MNPFIEIGIYVVHTLGSVFLLFVILRFLLQLARADFYNPFSQTVVKVTNPVLLPLRKVIPGFFGIDLASLVLALLVQLVIGELSAVIGHHQLVNPGYVLIMGALGTLKMTTYIVYVCLLVLVVTSFIAPYSTHPALVLVRQLMEPLLRPVQKVIPPMGGLDFSVLFVFMGVTIIQKLLDATAYSVGVIPGLIIGY